MTRDEAEELLEVMREHRDIFPRSIKLIIVTQEQERIEPRLRNGRLVRKRVADYGVGVRDELADTTINLWSEGHVNQFMTDYKAQVKKARERRRNRG